MAKEKKKKKGQCDIIFQRQKAVLQDNCLRIETLNAIFIYLFILWNALQQTGTEKFGSGLKSGTLLGKKINKFSTDVRAQMGAKYPHIFSSSGGSMNYYMV